MSDVRPSGRWPTQLDAMVDGILHPLPVVGEQLAGMAAAAVHEAARHALASKVFTIGYSRTQPTSDPGNPHEQSPASIGATTVNIEWTSTPLATHLMTTVYYIASPLKGTPVLDLTLETVSGTQLDPPSGANPAIRLNTSNGELVVTDAERTDDYDGTSGVTTYPEHVKVCSDVWASVASYPTIGRALSYGSAAGTATLVRLIVTYTNMLPLVIAIHELPPETVTA